MRTSQRFSFLAVALLVPCLAAYAKHGDVKNTSRPISGVTSNFQLLNAVIRPGEPIKIRVTLHNESASPVEFRYITGSFIEHVRIYDARHRQVPARLNAPFLESGAEKVNLQPGEQFVNVVTTDLWQMYDLAPGTYEFRFYYDLRLIADETLAAKSMKRYHSKDWILWDMKTYPLTVIDAEVSDSPRNSLEHGANASRTSTTVASTTSEKSEVSKNVTRLGATIEDFRSLWGAPGKEEILARTANLSWTRKSAATESFVPGVFAVDVAFLDGVACEIALRSNQRITSRKLAKLTKPFLSAFRTVDFAKPQNDSGAYRLSDGTFVWANKHKGHTVIVIQGADYTRNEDVFDQEAATIRPPTSNH